MDEQFITKEYPLSREYPASREFPTTRDYPRSCEYPATSPQEPLELGVKDNAAAKSQNKVVKVLHTIFVKDIVIKLAALAVSGVMWVIAVGLA